MSGKESDGGLNQACDNEGNECCETKGDSISN